MNVVVVESPAKAKTINKYLGSDYTVLASYGHVRDLPSKDGSVQPDEDFAMTWDSDAKSKQRVNDIVKALKGADTLILATDPDREGEAISWHVLDILKQKNALKDKNVQRVVFNAITKSSILAAMKEPRELDQDLIEAYLARRALDYLVGFTLSPVLWRKLPGSRSAGRVQSVALRLICDRELEIEAFKSQEYWTVDFDLNSAEGNPFTAKLNAIAGKKLGKFDIPDEASAKTIEAAIKAGNYSVDSVEAKPQKRNPSAPFTTSTLQQEASRKLGFSSAHTMRVAQRLYEGMDVGGETVGLITYMRTDGVQMAPEAIAETRNVIQTEFGEPYVPGVPRAYKTKAKNAQEAHEAIRPTELARLPKQVSSVLDDDQFKLYDLIWKRTIASQMESAELERTSVDIVTQGTDDKRYTLRASGSVVRFDGFLKLYQEGLDDQQSDDARRLPQMSKGDKIGLIKLSPVQHFTEPPPRYTEATMIKRMEELGIGRPSTYTSTLTTLRDREYVRLDKKRLIPEDKGRLVTAFLESFFARYVEYDFTASLEEQLDRISSGDLQWKQVLRDFWKNFSNAVEEIADLRVTHVLDALNEILGPHVFPEKEDGSSPRACPACDDGILSLKVGRFGAFVGCSNYPECKFTRQLAENGDGKEKAALTTGDGIELGMHPDEDAIPIMLREGRFGPYVQLGKADGDVKPRRASLPKGVQPSDVDLDLAVRLLSLPREIGMHPETSKKITAGLGRYGPFILHDGTYANIENFEELFTVGINRAVSLLAEKAAKSGGRAGALKELGDHPELGGPINVMSGRYGPYVKHGKINATLPAGTEPEEVTLEQAVEFIAAKAAKAGKGVKKKPAARKKKRQLQKNQLQKNRLDDVAKTKKRAPKPKLNSAPLPSEEEVREFIRNASGKIGKREIARAFNIKGAQRIGLKKLLKGMTDTGILRKESNVLSDANDLPPVLVINIIGTDADGELYGEPVSWSADAKTPPPRILITARRSGGRSDDKRAPGEGDQVLVRVTKTSDEDFPYEAKVIRRISNSGERIIGVFRKTGKEMRIEPVDRSARSDLKVHSGDANEARDGELVSVELLRDRSRGLKSARVRERLGALDDQRNISLIAISQHAIPDTFGDDVLAETDRLPIADPSGRTDMRDVPLITIDPSDARDHDDAIWAETTDKGCRIIVAIADVSWYVRPGTLLDKEARIRGNSTYFPDQVVPMLPERLSTDLCSLKQKLDRPALAAVMEFDAQGNKVSHHFDRVIIRVAANLSYEASQRAIDGNGEGVAETLLDPVLKPLWAAYEVLTKGRHVRQPLALDLPERKIVLAEDGSIDRVVTPERLEAHKLVEEFMIQANVCAAETLESKRTPLIYRLHDAPSDEKMRSLNEFLKTIDIKLAKAQVLKPAVFNKILGEVRGRDIEHLVNEVALRSQAQAVYEPTNRGHFGLNLRRYAHFTSPIRRYADLIVHRALVTAMKLGDGGLSPADIENLSDTAELISNTERRSMAAERQTKDRLMSAWLSDQVGGVFRGRIAGVTRSGLFVKLDGSGADGFIPASTLLGDYYVHDETAQALVGERSGETFRLGDKADVRLIEVTPLAGGLRFELLSEGRKGKPKKRNTRKKTHYRGKKRR